MGVRQTYSWWAEVSGLPDTLTPGSWAIGVGGLKANGATGCTGSHRDKR